MDDHDFYFWMTIDRPLESGRDTQLSRIKFEKKNKKRNEFDRRKVNLNYTTMSNVQNSEQRQNIKKKRNFDGKILLITRWTSHWEWDTTGTVSQKSNTHITQVLCLRVFMLGEREHKNGCDGSQGGVKNIFKRCLFPWEHAASVC